jgi:hypothetical protein
LLKLEKLEDRDFAAATITTGQSGFTKSFLKLGTYDTLPRRAPGVSPLEESGSKLEQER